MRAQLNAAGVISTLEKLNDRIRTRFPDAGLSGVCADLVTYSRTVSVRARRAAAPYLMLRALIVVVIAAGAGAAFWATTTYWPKRVQFGADLASLTQGLDAAVHLLLVVGAAVWTLSTVEQRLKRSRAIQDLRQLRSFAHVVDMHQLTKDPTVILGGAHPTSASPKREMSQFQLARYLEYCAEMLALIGKLAALYGEYTRDPQVAEAVNGVEDLAASLGRKIWQKITILSALDETSGVPANTP